MLKVDFPSRDIGHFFSIFLLFSDLSEKEIEAEINLDLDLSEFEDFDDAEDCDYTLPIRQREPIESSDTSSSEDENVSSQRGRSVGLRGRSVGLRRVRRGRGRGRGQRGMSSSSRGRGCDQMNI